DKCVMQEADDQGGVIGNQQPPSRMPAPKRLERAIIHCGYPDAKAASNVGSCSPFDTGPKIFLCSLPSIPRGLFGKRFARWHAKRRYCSLFVPKSRGAYALFEREAKFHSGYLGLRD